jgi:aspartate/methionine/tyrosine aminotransferase
MLLPSPRAAIAPFLAMEVAREAGARAASGQSIVRFDVGQPGQAAPEAALRAAERAIRADPLGYSDGLGLPALRRAIAEWYGVQHDLSISPDRIAITTGASGAFVLAFLALFGDGARVAMATPGYPPYRHILTALGMTPALIDAHAGAKFQLTPAHLKTLCAEAPLAGAVIASPANPTGAMLTRAELAAVADAVQTQNGALISDEIYHGLTYAAPATSALAVAPDAVVINSFSKYWGMTGWRVGWIVAPAGLVPAIERLSQNLAICPPAIGQHAALGALTATDECETRRLVFADNRALLLEALPGLGLLPAVMPDGAFYMLLDIGRQSDDCLAFCRRALEEAHVALTPGVDFCETRGRGWARLAYCQPTAQVEEGLSRLARWLAKKS